MPREVEAYYHDVVYFDPPNEEKYEDYCRELKRILENVQDETFFDYSSGKQGKTYVDGKAKTLVRCQDFCIGVTHFEYSAGRRNDPHIHLVYRCTATNNTTGVSGIVKRSVARISQLKIGRVVVSSERVRHLRGIRQYLRQGKGRVVEFEKLPVHSFCPEEETTGHFLLEEDDHEQHAEDGDPFEMPWLWNHCQEPGIKRKLQSEQAVENIRKKIKAEEYDESSRSVTSKIDRGSVVDHSVRNGKWLEQMFIHYLCTSRNQLEKALNNDNDPDIVARWETIQYLQSTQKLLPLAFNTARNKLKDLPFVLLSSRFFERQDFYCKFYQKERIMSVADSYYWLNSILEHNNLDFFDFFKVCLLTMDMKIPKKNCLLILGEPNAGKTLILESLARCALFYVNKSNFDQKSNFTFADLVGNRCALFNEPYITDSHVNTMKNILEGCTTTVDVKYAAGSALEGMPILITTNVELGMYLTSKKDTHQRAFDSRCSKFRFKEYPDLVKCPGKIHPAVWFVVANYMCREGYQEELVNLGLIDDEILDCFTEYADALDVVYNKTCFTE